MIDKKLIKLYAIAIISIALIITIVLYSFDFKAFLDKAEKEVEQKIEKAKEETKQNIEKEAEKIEVKVEEFKEEVEDKIKNKLKEIGF